MNTKTFSGNGSPLLHLAVLGCATAMLGTSAHAGFHVWTIHELFTNLDGTVQFIEFSTNSGSQQFVGGQTIQVKDQSNTTVHTFFMPSSLPSDSTNKTFLLATAGLQAAGGPAPDFTIPGNFLFAAGGTLLFIGTTQGAVPYTALPTDGVTSHGFPGNTNQVNSPKNFANATSQVVVPEPTTWALLGMGGIGVCFLMRRRAA